MTEVTNQTVVWPSIIHTGTDQVESMKEFLEYTPTKRESQGRGGNGGKRQTETAWTVRDRVQEWIRNHTRDSLPETSATLPSLWSHGRSRSVWLYGHQRPCEPKYFQVWWPGGRLLLMWLRIVRMTEYLIQRFIGQSSQESRSWRHWDTGCKVLQKQHYQHWGH